MEVRIMKQTLEQRIIIGFLSFFSAMCFVLVFASYAVAQIAGGGPMLPWWWWIILFF
jgi:hypothetical protein